MSASYRGDGQIADVFVNLKNPKTLKNARDIASDSRQLWLPISRCKATIYAVESTGCSTNDTAEQPQDVAATVRQDGLTEAVRQNLEMLQ